MCLVLGSSDPDYRTIMSRCKSGHMIFHSVMSQQIGAQSLKLKERAGGPKRVWLILSA